MPGHQQRLSEWHSGKMKLWIAFSSCRWGGPDASVYTDELRYQPLPLPIQEAALCRLGPES